MTVPTMKLHLDKMGEIFCQYNVELAYLFGSQARGEMTELSDVDFGIRFNSQVSPEAYGDFQAGIISELMLILERSDIDVD